MCVVCTFGKLMSCRPRLLFHESVVEDNSDFIALLTAICPVERN